MFRAWGKASSTPAANVEFKHISRVTGPSNRFWSSPKTKTPKRRRVMSLIVTNVQLWTVGRSISEKHLGFLGERYKEHLWEPSPIQVHSQLTGDNLRQDNFNIIGREGQDIKRLIKESISIRVNNPSLNRNIGTSQISHIWDRVLFSTLNIKVAIPKGNAQHSL